jgi:hypothetical protein
MLRTITILSSLLSIITSFQQPLISFRSPQKLYANINNNNNNNNNNKSKGNTSPTSTQSDIKKKKNPLSDSILFGKPQYNWVTGKNEGSKMTSSYIHNWNVRSKSRSSLSKEEDSKNRLSTNNDGDEKEKKSWWLF